MCVVGCVSLEVKGFMTLWEGSSRLRGCNKWIFRDFCQSRSAVLVLAELLWALKQLLR